MARTNNPHGRPVGSKNKATAPIRERISDFLNSNWSTVERDFKTLSPKDRLLFVSKILDYAVPKMQSVDVKKQTADTLSELSNEELNKVINTILENE